MALLCAHTGSNPSSYPTYVAIKGVVFDVSHNQAYAPGGSYHGTAALGPSVPSSHSTAYVEAYSCCSLRGKGLLSSSGNFVPEAGGLQARLVRPRRQGEGRARGLVQILQQAVQYRRQGRGRCESVNPLILFVFVCLVFRLTVCR